MKKVKGILAKQSKLKSLQAQYKTLSTFQRNMYRGKKMLIEIVTLTNEIRIMESAVGLHNLQSPAVKY